MGVFTEYQKVYAQRGIPTFPIREKRPAVRGYTKLDLLGSSRIASRTQFADTDEMGFNAGPASKLTVIDIDSKDERLWHEIIDRFGNTSIKVLTPSGGLHLWYLYNGEQRRTRFLDGLPVDLLGAGVVVAPPSLSPKGSYRFLEGGLDEIARLRPVANDASGVLRGTGHLHDFKGGQGGKKIQQGRNNGLFRYLMAQAKHVDDLETLAILAEEYVANYIDRVVPHPFTKAEIETTVSSVWRLTTEGKNRFGGPVHSVITHETRDHLLRLGSDALYLHTVIRAWSGDKETFVVANGMAKHMPEGAWTLRRFVKARHVLEVEGLIIMERPATPKTPAIYSWP